ncbi:MAG: AAA family ATPase [Bradyrhizobium sp.]|uniref:AAA family ATPase n=1 Tax=Bradyrhizobium sp. TaxID=376 RepID=UPI003D0E6F8E
MDDKKAKNDELVQIARLALAGRPQDVQTYIRRLARRYQGELPEVAAQLMALLQQGPTRQSPLRREAQAAAPVPVDLESRLQLLRIEETPTLETEPIWEEGVRRALDQIISERQRDEELFKKGLSPTRSILFTGPPGVGKTLAARWLARELHRPLLTLDLSAVMSSFLGRTGANVRHVLDYAKSVTGVLLLDELDAIAKRRDDITDVGELKRLVTVLLQEIDDWPPTGLLIAATNHADLLDPAVWRRFEMQVEFPLPTEASVHKAIETFLGTSTTPEVWNNVLAITLRGLSYSDIERELMQARRASVTRNIPIEDALSQVVQNRVDPLPRRERGQIALWLTEAGISQRQVHELTGVSRDTIRKKTRSRASGGHKGE